MRRPMTPRTRFINKYLGLLILPILVLISLLLLSLAAGMHQHESTHEVVRDVGIAFLVAAIVGASYEFHSRLRIDIHRLKDVLDVVMGEITRDDIWTAVKTGIVEKSWVREDLAIGLHVKPAPTGFPPRTALLRVKMSYRVVSLRETVKPVVIDHRLDEHLIYGDYPRFIAAKVGTEVIGPDELKGSTLRRTFDLKPGDANAVWVSVTREEVINLPGAYTLVVGSIIRGVKIIVDDLPDEIEGFAAIRPQTDLLALRVTDSLDAELNEMLLFPGQAIEFKFREKRAALPASVIANTVVGAASPPEEVADEPQRA